MLLPGLRLPHERQVLPEAQLVKSAELTRRFLFNVTVTHLQDKCQVEHQGSCLWTAHIPVLHATHAG